MRTLRLSAFFLSLFVLCVDASSGVAAPRGPADTVTEIVVKIKALRSVVPVVDYVDWDTAFRRLTEAERQEKKFESPATMKEHYFRMFSNPERFAREEMTARMNFVPAEQRAQFEQMLERSIEEVRVSADKMREQFREIKFDVGKERISGDSAIVELTSTLGDQTTTGDIELIRRNDRWYLPSVLFATTK